MKVFVYADGGSRGNPGIAGAGSLVIDAESKDTLAQIVYAFSGKASNNVAEYRGLIEGLRAAGQLGASEVYVFMDSKLVVEQMSGRWKIKHPDMQKLALEAREMARGFQRVTYTWVPRAQNKDADELSNVAMDASAAGAGDGIVADKSILPATKKQEVAAEPETLFDVSSTDPASRNADEVGTSSSRGADEVGTTPGEWCGATETPTRVILLRHGQTAMSAASQYAGHRDAELTDLGHEQVARAAEFIASRGLEVDAIISSPLQRCQQTAAAVGRQLNVAVAIDEGLIECDFGDYEGLTFAEADERDEQAHRRWLIDPAVAPPRGESLVDVHARVKKAVARIVDKHRGRTVVLVSHVNPIKSVIADALGADAAMFARLFLDLASITEVDFLGDGATVPAQVRTVNDTSFL